MAYSSARSWQEINEALRAWYTATSPRCLASSAITLNDYDQASDIAQQTFLQLYISLPNLRTNEPLKAWLFQVARNRCLDELRRKRAIHFSEARNLK